MQGTAEPSLGPAGPASVRLEGDKFSRSTVEALQAEVAQFKEELATLKTTRPQSDEPGLEPAALADPHKGDPRWSLHSAWLQKRAQQKQKTTECEELHLTVWPPAAELNKVLLKSFLSICWHIYQLISVRVCQ